MIDIISLLSTDGYIMCNKRLIKLYGPDAAILIGELCAEYNYHKNRGELTPSNSFYATQEIIEDNTGLNPYYQRKAIATLESAEIIRVVKRGLPARNYFWINESQLLKLFTASCEELKRLDVKPLNDINNNKQITIENNNSCKSKDLHSSAQGADVKTSQPHSYSDIEKEECFSKDIDFNFGKGDSINKKSKKNSNENELVTCYTMIECFSNNIELRKKLKDLFNMKKDICSKNRYHFSATTCMNYLDKLHKACKDENEMIGAVDLAIQYDACTTKIMIPRQDNNCGGKKVNYRLPEQKIATDEDRARDSDGNYVVF